MIVCWV